MKSTMKNWLLMAAVCFFAPCMAQSFEPAFDPTSTFASGEQDLAPLLYTTFDGNVASIYQQSSTEYGDPNNGESNIALIDQIDSEATVAQIWQVGMGLNASIVQTGVSNSARLAQVGIDHRATVYQEGESNITVALMLGEAGNLKASQIGDTNYMNVTLNTNSLLDIKQEGSGNTFSVNMAPNSSAWIVQIRQ